MLCLPFPHIARVTCKLRIMIPSQPVKLPPETIHMIPGAHVEMCRIIPSLPPLVWGAKDLSRVL